MPYAVGGGTSCPDRNEIWRLTISGSPTGGSFDIGINVGGTTDILTFNYNFTSAEVKTELATHTNITTSDVSVTGGDFPNASIIIEFIGDLAAKYIDPPTIDFSSLTGGSGRAVALERYQPGYPGDGSA